MPYTAYIVIVYTLLADLVVAYVVVAYIVMAYIFMALDWAILTLFWQQHVISRGS